MVHKPIDGLEFPEIRTSSFPRSGQDGIYIPNQFIGSRIITFKGTLSSTNYESQRRALLTAMKPTKVDGILQSKILKLIDLNNDEYRLNVQVQSVKMSMEEVSFARFMITCIAEDISIHSETQTTTTVETLSGGGWVYPIIYPITSDAGAGGVETLNNAGDTETFPVITLTGTLTNPRLENTTTGKFIALTLSITTGVQVVIDMENRTIMQAGETNRLNTMSDDSDFWSLQSGDNVIRLTTSIYGESGTASVAFRSAFMGL